MSNVHNTPFAALGNAIRAMRLRAKESILEVSAAIEVTDEKLILFETGELRPSEDVLELVINHFSLADKEADKLWDLAGYNKKQDMPHAGHEDQIGNQAAIMLLPIDARVVYTDMVHVMVNSYGVVMNFMQGAGHSTAQPLAVARVGMSREHAKSVLEVLQKTLSEADSSASTVKLLESPDAHKKTD